MFWLPPLFGDQDITAMVWNKRLGACQFHPEKSSEDGSAFAEELARPGCARGTLRTMKGSGQLRLSNRPKADQSSEFDGKTNDVESARSTDEYSFRSTAGEPMVDLCCGSGSWGARHRTRSALSYSRRSGLSLRENSSTEPRKYLKFSKPYRVELRLFEQIASRIGLKK